MKIQHMGAEMGVDLQHQGYCSYSLALWWVFLVHILERLAEIWSGSLQYSTQIDVFIILYTNIIKITYIPTNLQ
jgi:hypothetical protein